MSLYPSVMRAWNLCPSTWVLDRRYANMPGVEYKTFEWKDDDGNLCQSTFVQNRKGVVPGMLEELAKMRKWAKRMMAEAKAEHKSSEEGVWNSAQLAYKIVQNSTYGALGSAKGLIPAKQIAATVTTIGRGMIADTKAFLEKTYPGSTTVYGDSVTGPTPTTVRVDGRVYVETFELLADRWGGGKWLPCLHGKESCELPGVDVWTEEGWTPAHRIIRHHLAPEKRVLRVLTHAGMVDVTDEHSLLDAHGQVVSARYVEAGSELLYAPYPALVDSEPRLTPEKAIVMGMFCSDGARGKYFGPVPDVILNTSLEVRRAFWDGLYGLEGDEIHIEQKSQAALASYALLASSLGFSTIFDARVAKPDAFRLTLTERAQPRQGAAVKRVTEVAYEGWVYDLTTENHHFAAGAGQLVVHNTDSVMIRFEPGATDAGVLERCIRKGEEAAELATKKLFREPIVLEYEKVFYPFILCSKKRYAGLKYTEVGKPPEVDAKGLDLVRRDRIPLARELQKTILDKILFEKDLQGAVQACRQTAEDLLAGRIGLEKLTLSQQLKSSYANDAHAHLMVARKIRERMPGSEPKPGDRVPYVFIDIGDDKANSSAMAEDPTYALEQKLPINYYLYLRKHLINPLSTVLDLFVKHGGKAEDILFADIIRKYKNMKKGQRQLTSFFEPVMKRPKKEVWNNM